MKQFNGIWWTIDRKEIPGILTITDKNKIYLVTHQKLENSNIINGFAGEEKITLVDTVLDRTDNYYTKISRKQEYEDDINAEYSTYKYVANLAILGHTYSRKGDIRLSDLKIRYTNLDKWVNLKSKIPEIKGEGQDILVKFKNIVEPKANLGKFKVSVAKPYTLMQEEYDIQINNETIILVEGIANKYIESVKEIISCMQEFLVLCIGDNINVEKIEATDYHERNIEIILGYDKSNFENRTIFKNIIKYSDIKDNLESILKNWLEVYEDKFYEFTKKRESFSNRIY